MYELIGGLEELPTGDGGLDARRCLERMCNLSFPT